MSPQSLPPRDADRNTIDPAGQQAGRADARRDDALVVRNYDGRTSHEVTVRFIDANDEVALERHYTLSPGDVVSVATLVERGVYGVEAHVDDGEFVGTECLVGSGPAETALVEVGNGLVSVSEGLV
jgi:hypothetical protein